MDLGTTFVGSILFITLFGGPVILILGLVLGLKMMNARHAERMALINQGLIPPDAPKKKANPNRFVTLRNGIILVFLATGIIVGTLLNTSSNLFDASGDVSIDSMQNSFRSFTYSAASIVFFLGLGYLTYFFVSRKMEKVEENENDLIQE
jgi:hypothetical protein